MRDIKAVLGDTSREAQQLRPREPAKGERTRRNGPWGRVVGCKHRAWLCSQGLLGDSWETPGRLLAVGPAVAKRTTELSLLVFLLNRIMSVLQDVTQRGMAVHGCGKGCLSSKSSGQALVVSKYPNRAPRTVIRLRIQLKRE